MLYHTGRTAAARQEVALKVQKYCTEQSRKCQEQVQHDWRDQQRLVTAKEKIDLQFKTYQTQKEQLEKQTAAVEQAQQEIQEWLQQHEAAKNETISNGSTNTNPEDGNSIDDCVVPSTKVQAQMMDLSAENAAIADALYFLDKALYQGALDCSTHQKQVRRLAKRQFLVRAHLIKIQQVLLNNNTSSHCSF
jgi:ESCRT-I complex subunit TSG101